MNIIYEKKEILSSLYNFEIKEASEVDFLSYIDNDFPNKESQQIMLDEMKELVSSLGEDDLKAIADLNLNKKKNGKFKKGAVHLLKYLHIPVDADEYSWSHHRLILKAMDEETVEVIFGVTRENF
jgi:hypothetical protein